MKLVLDIRRGEPIIIPRWWINSTNYKKRSFDFNSKKEKQVKSETSKHTNHTPFDSTNNMSFPAKYGGQIHHPSHPSTSADCRSSCCPPLSSAAWHRSKTRTRHKAGWCCTTRVQGHSRNLPRPTYMTRRSAHLKIPPFPIPSPLLLPPPPAIDTSARSARRNRRRRRPRGGRQARPDGGSTRGLDPIWIPSSKSHESSLQASSRLWSARCCFEAFCACLCRNGSVVECVVRLRLCRDAYWVAAWMRSGSRRLAGRSPGFWIWIWWLHLGLFCWSLRLILELVRWNDRGASCTPTITRQDSSPCLDLRLFPLFIVAAHWEIIEKWVVNLWYVSFKGIELSLDPM
jgi:hypothetical protein